VFAFALVLVGQPPAAPELVLADATDPCTVTGTPGADVLTGTSQDDVICGFDGDDVLQGGGGKDRLLGGSGDDDLQGGGDNDRLRGGAGDDDLSGGGGDDNLRGGDGSDRMSGGPGRDLGDYLAHDTAVSLSAGNGANDGSRGEGDELRSDVENLRGGSGNDSLQGNGAANWLHGYGGDDRLRGGMANDDLYGGTDDDTLDGRDAASLSDDLFCGGGSDGAMADTGDHVGADCENVDQNRAPSDLSLSPASVAENQPVATTVGTLTVTDPNAGDTHSYGLVAGAGSGDNGSFTLAGNAVRTNAVFDYEAKSSYSVRIRVTDADGAGYEEQFAISVTDAVENANPVAVDDTEGGTEDTQLDLPVSGAGSPAENDTDPNADPLTVAAVSNATGGTAAIAGGTIQFNPAADLCGAAVGGFDYTVSDGRGGTDVGHVTVDLACVGDAPTAVDDAATVTEDAAATAVDVLANDTDPDGGLKAVASVTQPANGTVVITGGGSGLTYQPNANYCNNPPGTSPDTFTYTLNGGSTASVAVTVTCVDDAPTAVNDAATVVEDAPATTFDVLANDTDDGGVKLIISASDPANGTVVVTIGGSGLTYQPDPGYCNDPPGTSPDTFTYTLNGGSTATVSVTVTCVDNPPVAVNDAAAVGEDAAATAIDVLANDTDVDGGPKSVVSASDPANGTVVITGGGTGLTYQPDPNYCNAPPGTTPDTFTYTLNGGSTATVSVTVTCVDDPPVAVNDSATVLEDAAATAVSVLANDTDFDGGVITILSASDPANGTVVITGGGLGLTYQPDPNYCNAPPGTSPDTFTYTLNGGSTATVSMTVTCAPDNPVVDNSAGSTSYTENAAATVIDSAVTVSDPDPGATITVATVQITGGYAGAEDILALAGSHPGITPSVSGDTLTLNGTASPAAYQAALRDVTYRNSSEAPSTAPRTVTFTVTDETARTGSDTKGLTVVAVDDPPVAVNDSATVLEDAAASAVPVLTNDTDVDGGTITIGSASDPATGTVVITGGGTGLTYQPDPNYCNDPPGTTPDTFTYTLNGGSTSTVSMTVTCVNDAPVADDESFAGAIGNTALVVNDPDDAAPNPTHPKKTISGDILDGDTDVDGPGPLTVTAGTFATNDGGSVTIQADGDFTFHPAASTSCTDTSDFFDYTVTDGHTPPPAGTDTGRVTIAISGCVWYVNNNDPAGNSGTSAAPFDTLDQAEAASGANHTVFVFDGNNTSSGYGSNGYAMNAGERLIGEHEGLVVGADTLHPANPGAHPTLTATAADVIDLDDGNEVRGLNIDPQGAGGGIAGTAGDTGGGTIDDVNIVDTGTTGTQAGLELNGTTGTFNISNLVVNNSATGVLLTNAGTTDFGTTTITSIGAPGLVASGTTNMSTSTFDAITVTGSGSGGVSLTNTTGTTTFSNLSLTTTSGATAAFSLSNAGTVSVPAAGTANVSATGGPAVDVTGTSGATLEFDAVSSTNSSGVNGDGINLAGLGAGTFSATSGTISGATGIAFDLDGGTGAVNYAGALNNGSGQTAEITGRSGGAVTLSGVIADTSDAGGGISVSGNSGGSSTFSNASKAINSVGSAAVSFTTSDGHTLTLSGGGLDVDTTTGAGIHATDSGTLDISGTGNSVSTTAGTAVNVVNTDLGSATFQSISANGAASGIVLNNTGSTAGLTVSGIGSVVQGGDNSGGTIQSTTGDGISLTNTRSPSFNNMNLQNTAGHGVNGTGVTTSFSFTNGKINGAGDGDDESCVSFDDLNATNVSGTFTFTNNQCTQVEANGLDVQNWGATLSDVNISNNQFTDTGDVATPGSAVLLIGNSSASTNGVVTKAALANNTITDFRAGAGFVLQANADAAGTRPVTYGTAGSATNVISVTGNLMDGGNGGIGFQPDRFVTGGINRAGQGNYNVSSNGTAVNRIRMIDCIAIELQADGPVNVTTTVQNNFINANSAVGCAGIAVGTDDPGDVGAGTHSTLISGNNVMGTDGPGIFPIVRDSGSTMTARVLNNTVAAPFTTNAARAGIRVDSGSAAGDTTLCLEISGNTTAGSTNSATATTSPGINLRKQGTDPAVNTFGIEGMAATASPGVENYVNGLNTSTTGTFGVGGTALLSAQSGFTNCTAP
jgi:Bacterial Ig domain/Bacterial cadherin-like domain/RTX calcium-binding nonapeptide repeat (4 copies)